MKEYLENEHETINNQNLTHNDCKNLNDYNSFSKSINFSENPNQNFFNQNLNNEVNILDTSNLNTSNMNMISKIKFSNNSANNFSPLSKLGLSQLFIGSDSSTSKNFLFYFTKINSIENKVPEINPDKDLINHLENFILIII